jgi:hypothetical protein
MESATEQNKQNILEIDDNNLECISFIMCEGLLKDIYNNIYKLYNINKLFRSCITNILITDYKLLINILIYIKKNNININLYSLYFTNLFYEWNMEKIERVDIFSYLVNNTSEKIFNNTVNYYFHNYIENGVNNAIDTTGKINNLTIAKHNIETTKRIIYFELSTQLHNLDNLKNFELFNFAVNRNITVFKTHYKKYKYNFTKKQIIYLFMNTPLLYKYFNKTDKLYIEFEYIILHSKYAYNFIIKKNLTKTLSNTPEFVQTIINLNDKYDLNNNLEANKNYVYFILSYICIYNNYKERIIEKLNNNNLLQKCYNLIKEYISSGYVIYDVNKVNLKLCRYRTNKSIPKLSQNHYYKFNMYEKIQFNNLIEINLKNYNKNTIDKITTTWNLQEFINICNFYKIRDFIRIDLLPESILNILQINHPSCKCIETIILDDLFKNMYLPNLNKLEYNEQVIYNLLK